MNVKDAIIDLIGGTAGKLVAHRDLRDPSGTEYIVILFIYRRDCLCVCGSTPGHGQSEDADLSKHLLPRDDSLCPGDPEEGRSGPGTVRWHAPCTGGQCVRECRPFCSLWSLPKDCGHFLCSGRIQSGDDGTRRGGGGLTSVPIDLTFLCVFLMQSVEDMSPLYHGVSGLFAGFFCSFTLCPTELVKCRLQAMREQFAMSQKEAAHTLSSPHAPEHTFKRVTYKIILLPSVYVC